MFRAMRLFVWTSLLVLAIALPPASAQTGLATVTGIVTDTQGAAVPGVMVTATNRRPACRTRASATRQASTPSTALPIGDYQVKVELQGFKAVQSNASLSAGQTARVDAKLEVGSLAEARGRGDRRGAPDRERRRRRQVGSRTGGEAAHPGPQPVHGDALHDRRHHAESRVVQQPEEHGRRPSLRQRPARAGQQLHARRRRHERRHRQPDCLPAEPGRRGAGERRDEQLLARAGQRRRRDRQHGAQVGHQLVQRQRLLLLARQRTRGDAVGDQPRRRPQGRLLARHLRRHRRRPDREGQAVLLRRLPGRTAGGAACRLVHDGHPRCVAQRRPEQPALGPRRSSCAIR